MTLVIITIDIMKYFYSPFEKLIDDTRKRLDNRANGKIKYNWPCVITLVTTTQGAK